MASDSSLFQTADDLEHKGWTRQGPNWRRDGQLAVPLLEGKMTGLWNLRFGTYRGQTQKQRNKGVVPRSTEQDLSDPGYFSEPNYWVEETLVRKAWSGALGWCIGWRDIGPLERTLLPVVVPWGAVGDKELLAFIPPSLADCSLALIANLSSFVADYLVRQHTDKGFLKQFIMRQLPVHPPARYALPCQWDDGETLRYWVCSRAFELTYTSWALEALATHYSFAQRPFIWSPRRRDVLASEIDAAYFHLYEMSRNETEHILDSFRLVREGEEASFGEYRTKRLILEIYDAMAQAMASGKPYQTNLDPPPADPSLCHSESTRPEWATQ